MPEIEKWAQDIYRFVADKYGEENIVSFIVHCDEKNPHVHCALLPIDKDKKFAFKENLPWSEPHRLQELPSCPAR